MPYDPRMYEPNPGRDPATYIHQWDQPLNPRGDMPMQAPGVDPMSFQTRAEYESARDAALAHQREMAYRAQTAYRTAPVPVTPSTPVTTTRPFTSSTVIKQVSQSTSVQAKKTPEPPKPKYKPVKYLVLDGREPSHVGFWIGVGIKIAGMTFLTGLIYSFLLFLAKDSIEPSLSLIGMATSVLCWLVVVYRANTHSIETRPTEGSGPLWVGAGLSLTIGLILFLANRNNFQINLLALIGLVSALCVNAMHDGAEGITEEIVKMRQTRHYFQNSPDGQKCRLCREPAVAMRRYFFSSPNEWEYYIPVCTKHQHYICEIDGFGNQTWPQSGDCTQTGLVRATPKRFPKNVHPQRHR